MPVFAPDFDIDHDLTSEVGTSPRTNARLLVRERE